MNGLELRTHDMRLPLPEDMGDFEWVIHAAGVASPTYYRAHPIETMDANINGLRNLLDKAVAQTEAGTPVRGFLFFSSCEIYGDPVAEAIPTPETYRGNVSCTGPRACYDESKRYGETLCVNFAQQHGTPGDGGTALQQLRAGDEDHRRQGDRRPGAQHDRRA